MGRFSISSIIYIVIGIIVASTQGYFADLGSIANILSALLAVILWPLLLFKISLHLVF